jgi:hypothetical protein
LLAFAELACSALWGLELESALVESGDRGLDRESELELEPLWALEPALSDTSKQLPLFESAN